MTEDDPRFSEILGQAARKAFSEAYQRAIDSGAEVAVQRGDKVVILKKVDGQVRQIAIVGDIPQATPEQVRKYERLYRRSQGLNRNGRSS